MKSVILLVLSSIWLFVVFVPSVLSIMDIEEVSFISINLTDEEQEEQINQDFDEEIVLQEFSSLKSQIKVLNTLFIISSKVIFFRPHTLEIFLPPPK